MPNHLTPDLHIEIKLLFIQILGGEVRGHGQLESQARLVEQIEDKLKNVKTSFRSLLDRRHISHGSRNGYLKKTPMKISIYAV